MLYKIICFLFGHKNIQIGPYRGIATETLCTRCGYHFEIKWPHPPEKIE